MTENSLFDTPDNLKRENSVGAPCLYVARSELKQGLIRLAKTVQVGEKVQALLSFQDDHLKITVGGSTIGIPAKGHWPGVARVYALFLMRVRLALPTPKKLELSVKNGLFYIETWSLDAEWQAAGKDVVKLPLNPTQEFLASLYRRYSEGDIIASGLAVLMAEEGSMREGAIMHAAHLLERYGVSRQEVGELVDRSVDRMISGPHLDGGHPGVKNCGG